MLEDGRFEEGIRLFIHGDWFESHEVLEAVWRETPKGPDREFLQGLIQLAVASEHWKRGNPRGAWGQWHKAQGHLAGLPAVVHDLALGELIEAFAEVWQRVGLDGAVRAQAEGRFLAQPAPPWPCPRFVGGYGESSSAMPRT